ncbi:extradiol ring-cleavage dioxygenase [bacterium RCC_150]
MAEFLALGLTHYPLLAGTDKHMAGLLRWTLNDPDIPEAEKDPANWPELMQKEWADDQGTAAAAKHRSDLVADLAKVRAALDEFQPDLVVVWGDDQYENFREEVVPPFCILAYGDLEVSAFEVMNERGSPNFWGKPEDSKIVLHGDAKEAKRLADLLIADSFDMAYSYKKRAGAHFPHAILNTQLFLDYENAGAEMSYPFIPMTVNCYGQHAIARKGGLARFDEIETEVLDPAGPTPARCFQVGAAVARAFKDRDLKVAMIASSSWSHAFLADKLWHIRPDTDADIVIYKALLEDNFELMKEYTSHAVVDAGQHEILNWFCMLGAVEELGLKREWSDLVVTDVFNSNKAFAIYR